LVQTVSRHVTLCLGTFCAWTTTQMARRSC